MALLQASLPAALRLSQLTHNQRAGAWWGAHLGNSSSEGSNWVPQPTTLAATAWRTRARRHRRKSSALPVAAAAGAAAAPVAAGLQGWSIPQLQEGWPLWTAFALCAALGQVVERRTPVGGVLSAPLVSMLLALAGAAAGLLPTASAAADAIWAYLMPLGAACYLLESDLSQLLGSAGPTLAAFVVGAVGTLAGTLVAFWLVGPRLGPDGWKVASALCASYIGGAVNFAAVSQALALAPGPLLAGAMTADNCAMALYFLALMSIPAEQGDPTAAALQQQQQQGSDGTPAVAGSKQPAAEPPPQEPVVTAEGLSLCLAAAALACCLGNSVAAAAGIGSCALAVMALLASLIATVAARLAATLGAGRVSPFRGAERLGGALMMLFFSTIGTSAGSVQALSGCGWLLVFIVLQLGIHMAICIAGGRLLRLPMQAILIASNANVGGPATAAAMASAKGWPHMVQPAMLTGALGYAVATGLGIALGGWLKTWF